MDQKQKKMIDECIQAHYNMIKYHRKAILDLSRKISTEQQDCVDCHDVEKSDESG